MLISHALACTQNVNHYHAGCSSTMLSQMRWANYMNVLACSLYFISTAKM
jgi:hypothetical protein